MKLQASSCKERSIHKMRYNTVNTAPTVATLIYPAGKNLKHIWLSIVNFRCAGHVSASLTSNLNIDSRE